MGNRCSPDRSRARLLSVAAAAETETATATACGQSEAFSSSGVEGKVRSHDAGANYTQLCVFWCVCCGKLYSSQTCERRRQLSTGTGNWQHSNPISHACNHHDHYERKCRKSRRFLTATERPSSDRQTATLRPAFRDIVPPRESTLVGFLSPAELASCSNRIRTVRSLGGGISLCWA